MWRTLDGNQGGFDQSSLTVAGPGPSQMQGSWGGGVKPAEGNMGADHSYSG